MCYNFRSHLCRLSRQSGVWDRCGCAASAASSAAGGGCDCCWLWSRSGSCKRGLLRAALARGRAAAVHLGRYLIVTFPKFVTRVWPWSFSFICVCMSVALRIPSPGAQTSACFRELKKGIAIFLQLGGGLRIEGASSPEAVTALQAVF
jgi:hypothetical protein